MKDDEASASVVAFAVAGAIFLIAIAALFLVAQGSISPRAPLTDTLGHVQAQGLSNGLLTTGIDPDWNATRAIDWDGDPVGMPGLLDATGHLSLLKLRNLQSNVQSPPTLTHDEARAAFGLRLDQTFHVRTQPVISGTPQWPTADFDVVFVRDAVATPASTAELAALRSAIGSLPLVTDPRAFPPVSCAPTGPVPDIIVVDSSYIGAGTDASNTWLDCGGTLILLATANPCCAISYAVADASNSAPLRTIDPQHPVLNVPNQLGWASYAPTVESWLPADGFSTVIGPSETPLLQVSHAGAFGLGSVMLVRVQPTLAFGGTTATDAEAARLYQNLLLRHFQELYLDWGAPIPSGLEASPAIAWQSVCWSDATPLATCTTVGDSLGTQFIPVSVAVYVFHS